MKQVRSLLFLILMLTVLVYSPASAHEGREVGDYTIEIGWREEPAYTGLMNGPEITITRHGGEEEHEQGHSITHNRLMHQVGEWKKK